MTCAEFDRWLDEGMHEADGAAARTHASACARCAATLQAALAIETAFSEASVAARAVPARAPEGFASSVMARVRELEAARGLQIAEASPQRWWIRLLSDPVATVSITVSLLALGLLLWNPAWVLRFGGWLGAHCLSWVASAGTVPVNSTLWLAVFATATPFTVWLVWQIGRALERAMVLQVTRPDV